MLGVWGHSSHCLRAAVSVLRKDCGSNIASKHAHKHEARTPRGKRKEKGFVSIQTILVLFVLAYATLAFIKETLDIIGVVCSKLTTVTAPSTKNCPLADSFSTPMA